MADPIRLYSPNPLAPTSYGAPDTPRGNIFSKPPPNILEGLWGSLPGSVRKNYLSLAQTLAELSPGAAIRDTVTSSGDLANALAQRNLWGGLSAGTGMLTAMAGVVPGARGVVKGAEALGANKLASTGSHMASTPKAAEFMQAVDPQQLTFRETMQNKLAEVASEFPAGQGYTPLVVINDKGKMTILDGHNRASVARSRGDTVDAVSIPEPLYRELKARGLDDMDIAHAAHGWAGQEDAAQAIRQQFPGASFYKSEEKAVPFFDAFESGKPF